MALVPLSPSQHGDLRLAPGPLRHLEERPLVELGVAEAARAALDLPLVFIAREEGLHLCALLSPTATDNAQLGPRGRWMGGYMPALIRAHPLVLGPAREGATAPVLIDPDSDWFSRDQGEPLFDAQGQPSAVVTQRMERLRTLAPNPARDAPVLAAVAASGVLAPWEGAPKALPGPLLSASPARLAALEAEVLLQLHAAGALGLLYLQEASRARLVRLEGLAKRKAQGRKQAAQRGVSETTDFVLRPDEAQLQFDDPDSDDAEVNP
ncbi:MULTISPECIES: SapC family protein [Thiorhodovibrio]|uniref:SapC family protein n=1 Tax=Thiorhodovibrio TaxID=61593 RepID=UPI001913A145|nr:MULTISPECIES: SapC family protein [Thiorhodovibrio]MBK5969055.1 hypothetical protein [Thiorhodovibrio winogradskyi]WPL15063.1 SapC [Thiorhodovibrio litoralis]